VLLSGGIDSATCLYLTKTKFDARALTLVYHGIARQEVESAKAIGARAGVMEHRLFRLPDLREAEDMPGGSFGDLPSTYIPMKNSIFYSVAGSYAEEKRAQLIVGGHNRDDANVFRDVSEEFFDDLGSTLLSGSATLKRQRTRIRRPLSKKTKVQVVKLAASLRVPFELTWSCHRSGTEHCWECAGCLSRLESFRRAGIRDPLSPVGETKIT
jgi:7-cyano-7-deazaguanine synthase